MINNKKFYLKTNLIGFIVAVIIFGGIAVYAAVTFPSNEVSYDNSSSGLSSTNVKGAIDELYKTCTATAGSEILDKEPIVTIGDGLYQDELESCRYLYKGTNPNNYITYSGRRWRIVSIECDGTVKIVLNSTVGTTVQFSNLLSYLNNTYINNLSSNQITSHVWYVGIWFSSNDTTFSSIVNREKSLTWIGKVGSLSVSEAIRASSDKTNCGGEIQVYSNYATCMRTNWITSFTGTEYWAITPDTSDGEEGTILGSYYGIGQATSSVHIAVRPAVYLSSDLKITGGDGSLNNPYTIA